MMWGLLFMLVPIFGVGAFVISYGRWWLPPDLGSYGERIDDLFYVILWITAVAFVITEGALFLFLIRYRGQEGKKAQYSHSNRPVEIVWTIIPGVILLYIAFAQKSTWDLIKDPSSFPQADYQVGVLGRQFEWTFQFPGDDGQMGTDDDIYTSNNLHVPLESNVVISLESLDVLHSFFLPHFRLKQDAVPGMTIPVWFRATRTTQSLWEEGAGEELASWQDAEEIYHDAWKKWNDEKDAAAKGPLKSAAEDASRAAVAAFEAASEGAHLLGALTFPPERPEFPRIREGPWRPREYRVEIACAELCGLGHYRMRGMLVIESAEDVAKWLESKKD